LQPVPTLGTEAEPKREVEYPVVPFKRNELLLTMRKRVEEAFQQLEDETSLHASSGTKVDQGDDVTAAAAAATIVKNGSHLGGDGIVMDEKRLLVLQSSYSDKDAKTADENSVFDWTGDGSPDVEEEAVVKETARASSGLSLILDNYNDMEDDETDEIS
jgi:hypothetical protein